jgi:hypothetical protein
VLYDNVKRSISIKENSIFITLIGASQNNVLKLLSESALSVDIIGEEKIDQLNRLNLIKKDDFSENFSITAQGIWQVEKNKNIVSETQIVDHFQKTQFQRKKGSKIELKYREKVLLLSMIAARSFSLESAVNLDPRINTNDDWQEIFDSANQFLFDLHEINEKEKNSLYLRCANDQPIVTIFRRLTDFPKKTNFVYKFDKNLNYWLDMPESEMEFKDIMASLFSLVFCDKLSYQNLDNILEFCRKIAQTKSVLIFGDITKHKFLDSRYDGLIKEALIKGIKENN